MSGYWGAAAVVTLLEPGEEVLRRNMRWFHLPIVDVSVPDERFEQEWSICDPDDICDRDRYMGAMAETPETQLIEALKKVDVYGDIAPPHVQDPMTMVLRQNAIQADLIRWDDSRARFVLTGTGRNRITARSRVFWRN